MRKSEHDRDFAPSTPRSPARTRSRRSDRQLSKRSLAHGGGCAGGIWKRRPPEHAMGSFRPTLHAFPFSRSLLRHRHRESQPGAHSGTS